MINLPFLERTSIFTVFKRLRFQIGTTLLSSSLKEFYQAPTLTHSSLQRGEWAICFLEKRKGPLLFLFNLKNLDLSMFFAN